MHLRCAQCCAVTDFPDCDLAVMAVEPGDSQAFQVSQRVSGKISYEIFRCVRCGGTRAAAEGHRLTPTSTLFVTKVFDDPTPNGQINARILMAPQELIGFTDLNEQEQEHLFIILLLFAKKMVAVWQHKTKYGVLEDSQVARVYQAVTKRDRVVRLEHAQDLFLEFDEFLTQVKSSLDYLVKVPRPILGSAWSLQSFGDKGKRVIRVLKNCVANERKGTVKSLIYFIRSNQSWLEPVIEARDRINHMIGNSILGLDNFIVRENKPTDSSILEIRRPLWSNDQTIHDFMETVWENLLRFCENFIAGSISLRFRPGLGLLGRRVPPGSRQPAWRAVLESEMEEVIRSGALGPPREVDLDD
jgi:hypothetical protein